MTEKVMLYRARDAVEAALLAQRLEAQGIAATCAGGEAAIGFGALPADAIQVELWVDAAVAQEAVSAIRAFQAEHDVDGDDAVPHGSAWVCPACSETNEAGFELCWSCQAQRG